MFCVYHFYLVCASHELLSFQGVAASTQTIDFFFISLYIFSLSPSCIVSLSLVFFLFFSLYLSLVLFSFRFKPYKITLTSYQIPFKIYMTPVTKFCLRHVSPLHATVIVCVSFRRLDKNGINNCISFEIHTSKS